MENSSLSSFIKSVRERDLAIVEDRQDFLDRAARNVGNFQRDLSCVLRVQKKEDLQGLLEEANRWRVPLWPISKGFNWGYGSKLPVRSGVLLDLSSLNRIIGINEDHGVATIEPGVTQRQLAEELLRRNSRFVLDVTGSGADTSVLGNALERGIAYGGLRAKQLVGLEIFLGSGERFRTGFGGYDRPVLAGLYSYGLGPEVDGLFFQSNLGIVVEGQFQLTLRPETLIGVTVSVRNARLPDFVEACRGLLESGDLQGIPHLANRERTISTIVPLVMELTEKNSQAGSELVGRVIDEDWVLTASVAGSRAVAKAKLKRVKSILGVYGRIFSHGLTSPSLTDRVRSWCMGKLMTQDQRIVFRAAEPLRGFHLGRASNAGIQFLLQGADLSVDESQEGFLLCTPLAPLTGENAKGLAKIAEELAAKYRVRIAMTQNMITARVLEAVVSVHFSRASKEETVRAHDYVNEMMDVCAKLGFYPYRINIDQQHHLFAGASPLYAVVNSIKLALDPNRIIAPGRYEKVPTDF